LVALTLSDSFCVERYLEAFRELVAGEVDIIFGNQDELSLLYETDPVDAVAQAEKVCDLVVMTRGAKGSLVSSRGTRTEVAAEPVARVVDTTGAGDLFAAGFLYGVTHGRDVPTSARLGSVAAAEVISHVGARPELRLADVAADLLAV
jgi:sugar/nucleoside kinase (ribokinase family)